MTTAELSLELASSNFWTHFDRCTQCHSEQTLCRVGEALSAEVARARGETEEEQ